MASSDKKKTQQFLLEFVQDLVTDSPHAGVQLRETLGLAACLYLSPGPHHNLDHTHNPSLDQALLSKTSYLLEALYDINLLEEEVLLTWYEKGSKQKAGSKVRGAAEPFVKWLKEAEVEEDSDGDVDLEAIDE